MQRAAARCIAHTVANAGSELPREDSGKVFKRQLREPYCSGRARRV
jgi:hypothetical protein